MQVAIAGWYYTPPFIKVLEKSPHPPFIVKHREGNTGTVPAEEIPNVGLDFGCYDWFLKHQWAGGDTLYMQDDTIASLANLDSIAKFCGSHQMECCIIFSTIQEETFNAGFHGRCFWMSADCQRALLADGGFWFDESEKGHLPSVVKTGDLDIGNNAAALFMRWLGRRGKPCDWKMIVPTMQFGRRGVLTDPKAIKVYNGSYVRRMNGD